MYICKYVYIYIYIETLQYTSDPLLFSPPCPQFRGTRPRPLHPTAPRPAEERPPAWPIAIGEASSWEMYGKYGDLWEIYGKYMGNNSWMVGL